MAYDLEPDEVLKFLEDFIKENDIGENQHVSSLLEALAEATEGAEEEED